MLSVKADLFKLTSLETMSGRSDRLQTDNFHNSHLPEGRFSNLATDAWSIERSKMGMQEVGLVIVKRTKLNHNTMLRQNFWRVQKQKSPRLSGGTRQTLRWR